MNVQSGIVYYTADKDAWQGVWTHPAYSGELGTETVHCAGPLDETGRWPVTITAPSGARLFNGELTVETMGQARKMVWEGTDQHGVAQVYHGTGLLAPGDTLIASYEWQATEDCVTQIRQFAQRWNELYAATEFEQMKSLATENIGIANAAQTSDPAGLLRGRQAYYQSIYDAYHGASGKEHNLLVMDYEHWEYIPLDGGNSFYTIGRYTLEPDNVGVNSWLLQRDQEDGQWRISLVINN